MMGNQQPNPKIYRMGIIYMLTSPSKKKKKYIGQTIRKFSDRWSQHQSVAKNNSNDLCMAIHNAINKYGADNFKIEILLEVNDELLDFYEVKFINLYDTLYPNGYNLTNGGRLNHTYSPESRLKMSTTQKALYQNSEKMREQIRINGFLAKKADKSLPMYVSTYKSRDGKKETLGYVVRGHPNINSKNRMFFPKEDNESLRKALDFLGFLDLSKSCLPYYKSSKETEVKHITFMNNDNQIIIAYLTTSTKYHKKFNDNSIDLAIEKLNLLSI